MPDSPLPTTHNPLLVIVGPTASGKSALALELAGKFDGEIIAADSRTVYKGMDIGTAKPTAEEQAEVPHHLLDAALPDQKVTAADFKKLAEKAIEDIAGRGKLPIMVGGSGLYVDTVIYDYQFPGRSDEKLRTELAEMSAEELYKKLVQLDPDLAETVDKNNRRRLVRAIETAGQARSKRASLRPETMLLGIQLNKNVLRGRIEQRVEVMFRRGLRKEVDELVQKYGWSSEAMTAIGYREFRCFYDGDCSMAEVKRKIISSTISLVKNQRTWFKRNTDIVWLDDPSVAVGLVEKFLS